MGKQKATTATAYQIRLSENAVRDMDKITDYIAFTNQQPFNAIKVGDEFFRKIDLIQHHPYRYKECKLIPTKTKMYRQALCLSWYIIYKVIPPQIVILGIIHGSRKPSHIKRLSRVK